jgi:hypothetical protein
MKRPLFAVGSEAWICREIMQWARLNTSRYPWLDRLYHVPNEGRRNPMMASAIGIRSGVSDYHRPAPSLGIPDLWLEVKTKTGKLTQAQKEWISDMRQIGHWVSVRYTLSCCIEYMDEWCQMVDFETQKRRQV